MPKSGGGKKFKERIKKKINEASTPKTTEGPPTNKTEKLFSVLDHVCQYKKIN